MLWQCEKPILNKNFYNIEAIGDIQTLIKPEFNPSTKKWSIEKDLTK